MKSMDEVGERNPPCGGRYTQNGLTIQYSTLSQSDQNISDSTTEWSNLTREHFRQTGRLHWGSWTFASPSTVQKYRLLTQHPTQAVNEEGCNSTAASQRGVPRRFEEKIKESRKDHLVHEPLNAIYVCARPRRKRHDVTGLRARRTGIEARAGRPVHGDRQRAACNKRMNGEQPPMAAYTTRYPASFVHKRELVLRKHEKHV